MNVCPGVYVCRCPVCVSICEYSSVGLCISLSSWVPFTWRNTDYIVKFYCCVFSSGHMLTWSVQTYVVETTYIEVVTCYIYVHYNVSSLIYLRWCCQSSKHCRFNLVHQVIHWCHFIANVDPWKIAENEFRKWRTKSSMWACFSWYG